MRSSSRCPTVRSARRAWADCYDSAQVFLAWDGTQWNIFDTGTDIGCTSLPLDDQTLVACKALGYPMLTTATSRCRPGTSAARSWERRCGATSEAASSRRPPRPARATGPARSSQRPARRSRAARATRSTTTRPRCSTTGRPGAEAASRASPSTSGLQCSSTAGHSFFLSRGSWSVS